MFNFIEWHKRGGDLKELNQYQKQNLVELVGFKLFYSSPHWQIIPDKRTMLFTDITKTKLKRYNSVDGILKEIWNFVEAYFAAEEFYRTKLK